jgi:hypothetical protein
MTADDLKDIIVKSVSNVTHVYRDLIVTIKKDSLKSANMFNPTIAILPEVTSSIYDEDFIPVFSCLSEFTGFISLCIYTSQFPHVYESIASDFLQDSFYSSRNSNSNTRFISGRLFIARFHYRDTEFSFETDKRIINDDGMRLNRFNGVTSKITERTVHPKILAVLCVMSQHLESFKSFLYGESDVFDLNWFTLVVDPTFDSKNTISGTLRRYFRSHVMKPLKELGIKIIHLDTSRFIHVPEPIIAFTEEDITKEENKIKQTLTEGLNQLCSI